ncbi:MAG TPA: flagellar hook-basal body complex protein FliE [Hyphomicrobiaceae bacterium]|nr:flagellar hook-basal body complex protein FliE [Hyphomicrobiaceae bacterium]
MMIDPVGPMAKAVGAGPAQSVGAAAVSGATRATAAEGPSEFSAALVEAAIDAANVIKAGEAAAISGIRGQASVQQVVEAVMAAEQTLSTAIAIRDKVVSAYLEISRMQI